jgi:hypothetical protein
MNTGQRGLQRCSKRIESINATILMITCLLESLIYVSGNFHPDSKLKLMPKVLLTALFVKSLVVWTSLHKHPQASIWWAAELWLELREVLDI